LVGLQAIQEWEELGEQAAAAWDILEPRARAEQEREVREEQAKAGRAPRPSVVDFESCVFFLFFSFPSFICRLIILMFSFATAFEVEVLSRRVPCRPTSVAPPVAIPRVVASAPTRRRAAVVVLRPRLQMTSGVVVMARVMAREMTVLILRQESSCGRWQ
jgi:hypothetical protein